MYYSRMYYSRLLNTFTSLGFGADPICEKVKKEMAALSG